MLVSSLLSPVDGSLPLVVWLETPTVPRVRARTLPPDWLPSSEVLGSCVSVVCLWALPSQHPLALRPLLSCLFSSLHACLECGMRISPPRATRPAPGPVQTVCHPAILHGSAALQAVAVCILFESTTPHHPPLTRTCDGQRCAGFWFHPAHQQEETAAERQRAWLGHQRVQDAQLQAGSKVQHRVSDTRRQRNADLQPASQCEDQCQLAAESEDSSSILRTHM